MYENSIFLKNFTDIIENIETYANVYKENGILIFKKLNASEEQQYEILSKLGDILGWNPNASNGHSIRQWLRYEENHSLSIHLREKFGPHPLDEDILIHWHLEHIENDVPQVAAAWNMLNNNVSDPSHGSTGFVNCLAENLSISDEYLMFLKKAKILCTENKGWEMGWDSHPRQAVHVHKHSGKDVIRICPLGHTQSLISVNGRAPNEEEQLFMNEINWWFLQKIWKDTSIQFWWNWTVGDLIVPDLTIMAHSVRNGFNHGQRKFVGYWAFGDGYQKRMNNPLNT